MAVMLMAVMPMAVMPMAVAVHAHPTVVGVHSNQTAKKTKTGAGTSANTTAMDRMVRPVILIILDVCTLALALALGSHGSQSQLLVCMCLVDAGPALRHVRAV